MGYSGVARVVWALQHYQLSTAGAYPITVAVQKSDRLFGENHLALGGGQSYRLYVAHTLHCSICMLLHKLDF